MFETRGHWADKAFWWIAPVVILGSAGGGAYYYFHTRQKAAETKSQAPAPSTASTNAKPAIRHPLPGSAAQPEALPPLDESDPPVREALENLFGDASMQQMLVPESIVRRVVVTVDNLPRQKVAVEKRPLKPLAGQTVVATQGDLILLSEENFARYSPFMQLVQGTDTQTLADFYFRFYPLFQQAYEDLGYPGQYFNDRLVEAIDTLLATPEVAGPVTLVQPRVFYEFADPKLEALPAGQKVLLRMGKANAAAVKAKLRELRKVITSASARQGIVSPPQGGLRHWL